MTQRMKIYSKQFSRVGEERGVREKSEVSENVKLRGAAGRERCDDDDETWFSFLFLHAKANQGQWIIYFFHFYFIFIYSLLSLDSLMLLLLSHAESFTYSDTLGQETREILCCDTQRFWSSEGRGKEKKEEKLFFYLWKRGEKRCEVVRDEYTSATQARKMKAGENFHFHDLSRATTMTTS